MSVRSASLHRLAVLSPVFSLTALGGLAGLAGCGRDDKLAVYNAEPKAEITSPVDGAAALSGTALSLRGAASDDNDAAAELSARWFVNDAEACAAATPAADGTTTCDVTVPEGDTVSIRLEVIDPQGEAGTDTVTLPITPNAAPTATIESPLADGVYYSDQLITFRGTLADAEDDAASLTAWWEDGATRLDAVDTTVTSSGEVLGYTTLPEGAHALELHVQDTTGNEGIQTVLIDVGPPNSAPDCTITAPVSGGASEDGERVDFTAQVSDPDIASNLLSIAWTSDKDGAMGTSTADSSGAVSFHLSSLSAADHRITMTVTDEVGATCAAAIDWTVGTPPSIVLETPVAHELVNSGDTLAFSAYVADAEDVASALTVTWSSSIDGVFHEGPPDSSGLTQFLDAALSAGDHVLTVTVTDSDGLYATALGTFTVNGLPSAPGVSLAPASPETTDDLRVSIDTASVDPEGDALTYSYAWSVDGVASSASTSASLPASATTRGEVWRVDVTSTDGYGPSPAGSASVTIANSTPTVSVALSPASVGSNDTLTATATTADADGDTLNTTFDWYVDGALVQSGSTATLSGASAFDVGQDVYVVATVSDGSLSARATSGVVTVTNTDPVVSSVSVSPSTGKVGDVLTCAATATDADGGSPTLSYAWSTGATGASLTLTASNNPGDVLTCTATATDADSGTDTGSASATVSNTAPVMGTVSISPSTAYNDDLLTCSASATDADGGAPTLTYAWTNSSTATALGSGATLSLSSATAASRASIACGVTATDADGGTATGSASVTLGNRAPVATVSLTPASPTRTSTLTCSGSASDADADSASLSFGWTVGGSAVSATSSSASSSTLSGAFSAGQLVACTVTASDGKSGTDTDTASVTIGNNAPVVSSVTLSPSTVYTNDTLTANVVSSDADGDSLSLSYAWYVGGSLVSATSATLSGSSYFSKNQAVYVTATVNDGTTSTSLSSSAITVSNTAPTAPVVAITPVEPEAGDDLTCSVTTAATDVDGDALTYSFAWDVDGVDYASATDSATDSVVDGVDVGGEEEWTCEVEAGDGTGTSGVGTDSVTVAATCVDGNTVTATIAVGSYPIGVAVSPDGTTAYITNYGSNSVSVINTATNTVTATIAVGSSPVGVAVSPHGTTAYITSYGGNSVSVINTATNRVTATIAVGSSPWGVAVSPDGTTAYSADAGGSSVSVINTATNTVTATIAVGSTPYGVAFSPDGTTAYITNAGGSSVSVINTATNTVTATITVGSRPWGVAVSLDGTTAYTGNVNSNSVSVINTATNTVTATIAVGFYPFGVAVSPDGTTAYTANQGGSSVSVINTATNTVTATIAVGSFPREVAVSPDGTTAYITNYGSNSVSVIHICGA